MASWAMAKTCAGPTTLLMNREEYLPRSHSIVSGPTRGDRPAGSQMMAGGGVMPSEAAISRERTSWSIPPA